MYVVVYIYIHIDINIYIYMYTHIHMCIYIYVCLCIFFYDSFWDALQTGPRERPLEDYEGGRDLAELKKFASDNLGPRWGLWGII